jgi:tight adherence protein B
MTTAWLLVGLAIAVVPLGSRRSLRLAQLAGATAAVPRHRGRHALDETQKPEVTLAADRDPLADVLVPAAAAISGGMAMCTGPALGASVGLALVTAIGLVQARIRRRAAARGVAEAALVVRIVCAEVEAGASADVAVEAAAPATRFGRDLSAMAAALRQARDPTAAVPAELVPLAQALRVSAASGASAAEVLGVVQGQLQAVLDQSDAVAAALAGARSSALLLAVLPVVGLVLGMGLGANPLAVLGGSQGGHGLVLTGVALECAGLWWTSRLAASAEAIGP